MQNLRLPFQKYTYLFNHRSPAPDPAHDHTADDAPMEEEQIVWRGDFTMHGMAKFSAVAYAVSGPVEHLDEVRRCSRKAMIMIVV